MQSVYATTVNRIGTPSLARASRPKALIATDGDRSRLLAQIAEPTRVIHGKEDPLVPVPATNDRVQKIHQAMADIILGMGHDLPEPVLPRLAAGIAENAARAG